MSVCVFVGLIVLPLACAVSLNIEEVAQDVQVAIELDVLASVQALLSHLSVLVGFEIIGVEPWERRVLNDEALDGLNWLLDFKAHI